MIALVVAIFAVGIVAFAATFIVVGVLSRRDDLVISKFKADLDAIDRKHERQARREKNALKPVREAKTDEERVAAYRHYVDVVNDYRDSP